MKIWALLLLAWILLPAGAYAESVLAVSDTHMRADTDEFDAAFTALTEAAAGRDVLVMLGDNTNNGRPEEHALALEKLRMLREKTGTRIYVIPGNHDYSGKYFPEDFRGDYGEFGIQDAFSCDRDSVSCAVMTDSGTCLLLLDTNRYDTPVHVLPDGGISEDTLRWVEEVLAGLGEDTPVIACGHHPILPESREMRTPGAKRLEEIFRKYGVTLYLCGHDHGFATGVSGSLRQITVGQPQVYPGMAGSIRREENGFSWTEEIIFDRNARVYMEMKGASESLAFSMARGALEPTVYQGDEDAIAWFARVFMTLTDGSLNEETASELLKDGNSRKWREAETRGVIKDWLFSFLENCPEDMHYLQVPLRSR